jgi:DNA modification methylase
MATLSLVPSARNARLHSEAQIQQIMASIREWGWTTPVLVDERAVIIAGHGRVMAAERLELVEVPVVVARGWSEAQKRAYLIADNKLSENASWDQSLLQLEISDLKTLGFDALLTGFSEKEIADLVLPPDALPEGIDDIPAAPEQVVTRPGDLWQIGRHRLICGDCRDAETVARLIDGRRINIGFTSPPYAEQRNYDSTSGFKLVPPDEYVAWFAPVAANVAAHLADDGSWFVNIKPAAEGPDTELYVFDLVLAHARQWGWHFATEFCWERAGVPKGVSQRFKNQFEPIYQFAHGYWKMRPGAVRHKSDNVPMAGGPGSGNTTWKNAHGEGRDSVIGTFGAAKKRRNGMTGPMCDAQGQSNYGPGEYVGPGLAYPGNRLPTFSHSHDATGHAAAFPVGLPAFFCLAYSDADDLIFDPFCGSGSTLVAADHTGRVGAGCEISPLYCDITIARLRKRDPTQSVTLVADARSYDDVAASRTDQRKTA